MRKTISILIGVFTVAGSVFLSVETFAQPYGAGTYGEDVPYGGETALSIATDGNVTIPSITPLTGGTSASGNSVVTVTSTDVVGFELYVRGLASTAMNNLGDTIPASGNGSPAALAVNTWGYNVNGSANYVGMTLSDVLVKSFVGPASSGDITTFTYGIRVDLSKPAGTYTTSVIYTAVPQTD